MLIVAFIAVILVGSVMLMSKTLPVEVIMPTIVALDVVLLAQIVEHYRTGWERNRQFSGLLLQVHDETSHHLETIENRRTQLNTDIQGVAENIETKPFAIVREFPMVSWTQFREMGGLVWLYEVVPFETGARLLRYYYAVGEFNKEVKRHERIREYASRNWDITKLQNVAGVVVRNVVEVETTMKSLLDYMASLLPTMYSELYYTLLDHDRLPGHYVWTEKSGQRELMFLRALADRGDEEYHEWRRRHGLPPKPFKGEVQLYSDDRKES